MLATIIPSGHVRALCANLRKCSCADGSYGGPGVFQKGRGLMFPHSEEEEVSGKEEGRTGR